MIYRHYPFMPADWVDDLPKGWHGLFTEMCREINNVLEPRRLQDKLRFLQIKEKFGEMRCYAEFDFTDDHTLDDSAAWVDVNDIISKYEILSGSVCHRCGKPAEYYSNGWILPYCKECAVKHVDNADSDANVTLESSFKKISKVI